MKEAKRTVTFSPNRGNQNYIRNTFLSYVKADKDLKKYYEEIKASMVEFLNINDSYVNHAQVSQGNEITVFSDAQLRRIDNIVGLEHLCQDEGIPCIEFSEKDILDENLVKKINNYKEKILLRLVKLFG